MPPASPEPPTSPEPPERPRRARGGRPAAVTREEVLDAALALVDEQGLPALSMRKLGTSLGVDAMTIYSYVADKAALVDALVERQANLLDAYPPPTAEDPFEILIEILGHYRRAALLHPNLTAAVAARPFVREIWEVRVAGAVALLEAGGIPLERIALAADALATFSMGFIVQEAGEMRARADMGENAHGLRTRLVTRRAELEDGSAEARAYDRRIAELDGEDPKAETFEQGLRAMLHGLRDG